MEENNFSKLNCDHWDKELEIWGFLLCAISSHGWTVSNSNHDEKTIRVYRSLIALKNVDSVPPIQVLCVLLTEHIFVPWSASPNNKMSDYKILFLIVQIYSDINSWRTGSLFWEGMGCLVQSLISDLVFS